MGRVIKDRCYTHLQTRQVLTRLRQHLPRGKIPCPIYPMDSTHVMQLNGRTPPGLRCRHRQCARELKFQPLFDYIATFVTEGIVDQESLLPTETDDEVEQVPTARELRSRGNLADNSEEDSESSLSSGNESAYTE